MPLNDELKRLNQLYELTGQDWTMDVHFLLTEPVGPTAIIYPEGSDLTRYHTIGDTIEEAVKRAIDLVYKEVIQRQRQLDGTGSTPDDHLYTEWLNEWIKGSNAPLPDFPDEGAGYEQQS